MRIIPAIDIIEGKCVRLTQGDYSTQKIYNHDPLEVAKEFEDAGIMYLHVVDLDGAKSGQIINYRTLERIATHTALNIDFGGGLKSDEDLKIAFESGAKQITGGSIAVKNPKLFHQWIEKFGSEKIILGADSKDGFVAVSGWHEKSEFKIIPFIQGYMAKGLKYVICTDISKDGMLEGPSVELYKEILDKVENSDEDINLIASGGVSKVDDLYKLKEIGCEGAIVGKAIYENRISLKQLEQFILENQC